MTQQFLKSVLLSLTFIITIFISAPSGAETRLDPRTAEGMIKGISTAILVSPYDAKLYTRRAMIYTSLGRYDAAAKDMTVACQLSATAEAKKSCERALEDYKYDHRLPR